MLTLIRAHGFQRPLRALLSIVGVAFGVLASVAIGTANIQILRSFEHAVTVVAGPASLEIVGHDLGVEESVITRVRGIAGVVSASPVIDETVLIFQGTPQGQVLQILGLDLLAESGAHDFYVSSAITDERLEAFLAHDSVYLGRQIAADWNLGVGEHIEGAVGGRRIHLRVAGVLDTPAESASRWDRLAIMDIAAAQVLFHSIGRLDRIMLVTDPERPLTEIADTIRAVLPAHLVVQRPIQRTDQLQSMVRAFQLNLTVLSWVGLLVGMFLIYNTMAFTVAQRRREIGIYRALGMTSQRVTGLILMEAGVLGFLGGLLGGLGGVWLAKGLVVLLSRTISDLYVPVSLEGVTVSMDLFTVISVAKGVAFGTVVSMVGAVMPSLEAGRTRIVRALSPGDYELTCQLRVGLCGWLGFALMILAALCLLMGPIKGLPLFGYLATLCLLAGLSCFAPLCIQALGWRGAYQGNQKMLAGGNISRVAADQAARHVGRNAVTVSALLVGLSIMIGVVVMVRSFRDTVEVWVNETVLADLIVAPESWLQGKEVGQASRTLPETWRGPLLAIDGIAAVDLYRAVQVEVEGKLVALVSRDLRLHAQRSRYLMVRGDSTDALVRAAETGGVLLSEMLATRLQLEEGNQISLMTPTGQISLLVEGIFYDYATDGGKIVMDRVLYQRHWQDNRVTVFPLYLVVGGDAENVRQAITRELGRVEEDTSSPLIIQSHELRKEILAIFDRTFILTYALEAIAVLVAILGIVNTLVIAVITRQREFATLRALGASPKQVERLVLWEAAYLGLIGAGLGVGGGLLLALVLIRVINKQSFGWTIQMSVPSGLIAQAVGLAFIAALVAGYFPARWAARQPIVEGLREE